LSELAKETGLAVSTTSRLIGTLVGAGYLRKTPASTYVFGPRMLKIALACLRGSSLFELAGPRLQALRDQTGETANLAVRNGPDTAIYIRLEESPKPIRHNTWLGQPVPLCGTAIGAAILGDLDARGYAVKMGSLEPDVAAIAAPVRDSQGEIVGGISITMPLYRATEALAARIGEMICAEAQRLSLELNSRQRSLPATTTME
jgi:DNA-binding IclR family transcriptional regulator